VTAIYHTAIRYPTFGVSRYAPLSGIDYYGSIQKKHKG